MLTFKTAPNFEAPTDAASTDPANDAENNEYIVEVTATGGAGSRELTADQTITVTVTDDETEAPSAPSAPTISAETATGFTATWTAPKNAGPAITGYAVQYREGTSGTWTSASHSGTTLTVTLTGLNPATAYQVQVQATNAEGTSAWSAAATGTTTAAAGVTVSESTLTVNEGGSATYTVVLDIEPTAAVEIAVAKEAGGDANLTVAPSSLTFSTSNWNTAQTVTVSAADDDDAIDGAATVTHSATSTDSAYSGLTIASLTATEDDNDTPGVTVNPEALPVAEGSTASYTVALTTQPTADVTVSLSRSGDSDLTVSTTALTFTTADWSTAQTVTVTAADDDDAADGTATIAHTASSADSGYDGIAITIASLTATEDDDDTVGVTVDPETLTVTEESTAAYTVVLATLPTGPVTVSVAKQAGGDDDLSVAPAELTFTTGNWNTAQTVTVSAADDGDTDDGTATIEHTATSGDSDYHGIGIADVLATEDDNDEPNAAPTFSSAATFSVAENAPAVGTVAAADADASDSITGYTLAGGADQAQFSIDTNTGALTFKSAPNFEAPADAASTDPANDAGNNEYIVVVRATGGAGDRELTADQTITVTVTDVAEAPSAPAAPTISAETATGFTVTWTEPENKGPEITGYAVQYREGTSGSWTNASHSGTTTSLTLSGLTASTSYQVQVLAKNAEGTSAWSATATGTTTAAPGVTISTTELSVPEGSTATYTVVLTTQPTNNVTVTPTVTGDSDISVSGALTFTTTDWNTAQTVMVSAAADADTENGTATITHAASGGGYGSVSIISVTATEEDDDPPAMPTGFTVTAKGHASIELAWTDPGDATITRYEFRYKRSFPGATYNAWQTIPANDANTVSHLVTGLTVGTNYVFQIRAVNGIGPSAGSTQVAATAQLGPPPKPTGVTAAAGNAQVTLMWADPGDGSISRYEYRQKTTGAYISWVQIPGSGASTTDYTVTALSNGVTYTFQVRAVRERRYTDRGRNFVDTAEGAASDEVMATPIIPPGVTLSETSLTVPENGNATYTVVLDTEPTGLVTVNVAKSAGGDADLTASPTVLTFTTANWDTAQTVTVSAADDGDTEDGTATIAHTASGGGYDSVIIASVTVTEDDNDEPNAAPTFSSAATFSVAENEPAVGTVAAADADASDSITGYALAGGADQSQFSIDTNTGALTFKSAPNYEAPADVASTTPASAAGNNEYIVEVTATGGTSTRALTATQTITVTVTDVAEAPSTPATPTISAETETGFTVSWTAPANTGPAITDYDVQYREGTSGSWTDAGHSDPATSLTLSGLTAGTSYQVQVQATNDEGTSAWSASATGTTAAAAVIIPAQPTALTAAGGHLRAELSWTAPAGPVTKYQVRRSTDGGTNWSPDWTDTGTDPATATSMTVSGLSNGTAYTFAVRAVNAAGAGAASASVTVTPADAVPDQPASPVVEAVGDEGLLIAWQAPENRGSDITRYWLERQVVGSGSWFPVLNADGETFQYLDNTDPEAGTTYVYRVTAYNDAGGSVPSAASAEVTPLRADVELSASALEVPEGGNATYTVSLTVKPTAAVTVAVSSQSGGDADLTVSPSSLTFTTGDWSTAQTVTVSAAEDADAVDGAATFEHRASGGDYAGAVASVTATEEDNEIPSAPGTPTISAVTVSGFTVTWTAPAGGTAVTGYDVEYRVTGATTWTDGGHSGTALTLTLSGLSAGASYEVRVRAKNANGNGAWSATATATTTAPSSVPAQPTALTATGGHRSAELSWTAPSGPVDKYQYRRSTDGGTNWSPDWTDTGTNPATATGVTVTGLTNGTAYTFEVRAVNTAGAGAASASVTVTPADVVPGQPAKPTAEAAGDGGILIRWRAPENRGSAITQYSLEQRPAGGSPWVQVARANAGDREFLHRNRTVLVGTAYEYRVIAYNGAGAGTPSAASDPVTAVAASVTVSATALAVPEGSSATYSIGLTVKPGGEVVVAVALSGDSDLTVSPTSLTFTTDNWSTARTVTVNAAADADGANGEAEIAHTVSGGGYDGKSVASVTAREVDDDPGVRVLPPTLSVPENGSAPYTVVLQSAPSGAVTVTLALTGDSDLTASATALTFTTDDWSTAQTVTVSAADDADAEHGEAEIEHTASGGGYAGVAVASVTATEADDDTAGVSLSAPTLSVPEQGTASYTVVLDSEPTAAVTVTPTATGDSDISVSGALTFTTDDWSTAQTVTVTAADDGDTANGVATIAHAAVSTDGAYNGLAIAEVTATEADDDGAALEVSESALTVAEGGTDTWTVRLASEPTASVVKVRLTRSSDGDPGVDVSPRALTFTPADWSTAQTVTVSAAEDDDAVAGEATFTHTAQGGDYEGVVATVEVTEQDNDVAGMALSANTLTMSEGDTASYTVVLDTRPSAAVTVSVSVGGDSGVTVSPTTLTFTPGVWNQAVSVTVRAARDLDGDDGQATLTHTASGGDYAGLVASLTATVTDSQSAGVTVSESALTVPEGGTATYTVVLDAAPTADVAVTPTATGDSDLSVSGALTFTTDDWSTAQTVTVSAAADGDSAAGTATITHTASGGGYDSVSIADVTATEDDNNAAPTITSPATFNVAENGTTVGTVAATDADTSDSIGYTITGGADQGKFAINPTSGALTFDTVPNYEDPTDVASSDPANAANNNEYVLVVTATSGTSTRALTATQTITVTVTDVTEAPSAPAAPTISAVTETGFTVTWTEPANSGPAITAYDVQYREGTSGSWTDAGHSDPATTLTLTGLTASTSYQVQVQATNAEGTSAWSASATATTAAPVPVPAQPTALTAAGGHRSAELSWTAPTGPVTKYQVRRSTDGGTNWSPDWTDTGTDPATATTVRVTGLDNGTAYTFEVRAVNTTGAGAASASVTVTPADVAPGQPASPTAEAVGHVGVLITWQAPENAGSVITSYWLERQTAGSATWILVFNAGRDDFQYLHSNQTVLAGETYVYRVRANNAAGGSSPSAPSAEVTPLRADVAISESALEVPEGGSASYEVSLPVKPTAAVTVTMSTSGDTDLSISPLSLTFRPSNWETAQTVTVAAGQDADGTNGVLTISHSVRGGGYGGRSVASVTATERDDESGIRVSSPTLDVPEGGSATYTVVLQGAPSAGVTVAVSASGDSDVTALPTSLTFTTGDWSTAQTVTVSAGADDDAADGTATIAHTAASTDSGYSGATVSVTAREDDDDTVGVTVTPKVLTVPEERTATYTVVLNTEPTAEVTVGVAKQSGGDPSLTASVSALTFTTTNWSTAQTVTVSAAADVDTADGAATFAHSASGGDYASVSIASVAATESDNDTAGLTVTPEALTVTEGGSATWTVVLDTEPTAAVTVTVSKQSGDDADLTVSPSSLTFTTGDWSTAQTVTVSAAEDADGVNGAATFGHRASGGSYEGAVASVTATEEDNETPSAPGTPTISAVTVSGFTATWTAPTSTGGSAVTGYDVAYRVTGATTWTDGGHSGTALTLTLTGLSAGASYEVRVRAKNANGDGAWSATATATTTAPSSVPAQPTALTATGGHQGAALSWTAPTGPVDKYQVRRSTDGGTNWSPDWTDTGTNPATATSVTVTGLTNGTAYTFEVRAVNTAGDGAASASVTVTPADVVPGQPAQPTAEAAGDGGILIRWRAPENRGSGITQYSLERQLAGGSSWVQVARANAGDREFLHQNRTVQVGTAYEYRVIAYNGAGAGTPSAASDPVTAVAASVTVSETALAVPEGSSATYSIGLTVKPGGEVTVTLALTGDSDLTANPTSLTFTTDNWSTARTVTVSAAADADGANGEAEIAHTVSGGGYDGKSVASVTAREVDDDPGVRVLPPTLSVPETGSAPYTVVLQSAPGGSVTVTLALTGDSDLTASATALTFTTSDWSTAQTVTVSAADDADAEHGTATIAHTASGGSYAAVAVASVVATEADDDTAGVSLSATMLSVSEQGTASYTVVLDSEPAAAVTVTPAATGDSDISVSGALTFTTANWNTAQTVTVSAADDGDTANGVATIAHAAVSTDGAYDGLVIADVEATEADDDSAALEISKSALTVAEGGTDTWTVRLASEPTALVVNVRVTRSGDPGVDASPRTLTFTPADWSTAQTVTVSAAEDDDAVEGVAIFTHTGYGGDYEAVVATVEVTEQENDVAGMTLSANTLSMSEGDIASYTVVLDTRPSAAVTVSVSVGGDSGVTVSPPTLTFTPGVWNQPVAVTVKAAYDLDGDDGQATLTHTASGGDYAGLVASLTATVTDSQSAGVTVSESALTVPESGSATYTVVLDMEPTAAVTVTPTATGDSDLGVSGVLTFTTDDWSTAQTVTVSAGTDADATDGTATIAHTASGGGYDSVSIADVTATEDDNNAAPTITSTATFNVAENGTTVGTVTATDADAGDSIGYAFTGGADQTLFSIDAGTGALTFQNAPNYEAPADADMDNAYLVEVTATSGTSARELTAVQAITVTVTDVNEPPSAPSAPTISSVTATGFTVTWTAPANTGPAITGYAVQYREGTSGPWTNAGHSGTDPSIAVTGLTAGTAHQVQVQATNAEGTSAWSASATATTVANEAPTFSSGDAFSVAENATAVGTVTATDADASDSVTGYAVTGGADRSKFSIDANSGALTFTITPNYEAPADADMDNAYLVEVTATSGTSPRTLTAVQAITVTVTDVNEPPSAPSAPTISSVTATGFTVTWTAPTNTGPAITGYAVQYREGTSGPWTNAGHSGTDPSIAVTGLTAGTAHQVQVQATNAEGTSAWSASATATTVANEAPTFSSGDAFSVAENATAVGTVTATDADASDSVTGYAVTGGADRSKFSIDANSGALTFTITPNYEAPADADMDNAYLVEVTATSGTSPRTLTAVQAITVTVTDVNEPPSAPSAPTISSVTATGFTVTWTAPTNTGPAITGYAVQYREGTGGPWTNAGHSGTDPSIAVTGLTAGTAHQVQVQATNAEGTSAWSASASATTVANEAPTFSSGDAFNVAENATAVGTVTATDADASDSVTGYAVTGGADRSKFSIDANSGALTFTITPNYEAPADADMDNAYLVEVTAPRAGRARGS